MKRLWFQQLDSMGKFPDGRIKLEVKFKDDFGNFYLWTPRWKEEVEPLFLAGLRVEKTNKPESEYLHSFAETARDAFKEASNISEAYFATGKFIKFEKKGIVLCRGDGFYEPEIGEFFQKYCYPHDSADKECNVWLPVGFQVTAEWLLANLDKCQRCLVINGVVVKMEPEEG